VHSWTRDLVVICLSLVGVFLLNPTTPAATNTPPKRVLILDSFGRDVAPFNAAAAAFRTTLARELGGPVDIYEESLDLARFGEAEKEEPLVEFLQQRFADRKLDLVVPISAPAVTFAARWRERLFPNTPMVITGTDQRRLRPAFLTANTTVVSQNVDLSGIIEDLLQVLPDTQNIMVVLGASPLEKFWVAETRREFQQFAKRIRFTWLNDLTLEEMQKRAAALPRRSAILYGMLILDAADVPYDSDHALKSLRAIANGPIFGYFQSQFGLGIVGGRLYQDHEVGARAARVAIRILRGEPPSSIPPQLLKTAAPVYDWRELRRWDISESRLPPGSIVEFRQPTFWEQYQWLIMLVLALCLLEAALIDILLRERRRRRLAQQKLEERLRFEQLVSELSSTFINLPTDKVEAQIIDSLGQVASFLRFDIAALSVFTGRGTEGRVAYIWRAEGVPEIPSDLTDKDFPWSAQELFAGRDVCLRSLEMLPLAGRTDRATYEKYHVRSSYSVPMVAGGKVIGVLGLNTVGEEREMPRELLQGQRLLGEIFANALARRAAEQSRRESEQNFRSLVETTAAVPWQADIQTWVFTYVGPQAVRLLGYPVEQWYEKDFWVSHLHPDDKEFAVNTCLALSKTAEDFEFEYRMLAASGETVWVHDIVKCEHRDGKPAELRGFMLDISERKQAEEALRESEERISLAANTAGLGLWVWDATRDESWVTPEGRRLFGWTESELVNLERFIHTLHPDDREPTRQAVLQSLQNGGDYVAEYRVVLSGGAFRWIATRGRIEFDGSGRPLRLRGVSLDITERKTADEALRESEKRFRTMADTAPVMIWMSGTDKLCTFLNKGWLDFTGRTLEQELGNGWAEGVHREDFDHCLEIYANSFDARQEFIMEYRLRRRDGEYRWVLDHSVPRFAPDGTFLGYIGTATDITELKRGEETLEKQRAFLRQVIDIDPNFIFAKDREGRFTLVNQALADAYGTTVETLIGKTDADFNSNPEEVEFFRRMDLEVMDTLRERFIPEEPVTNSQGEIRWVQTVKRPILDKDGSANQVLGASTDITQRKKAESELQHNRQELAHVTRISTMGELAASLAHELNQPLTAILSNAQAAQRFMAADPADLEEVREILKDIVQDDSRASEVIQRMRALVKKEKISFVPLDLADVIREVELLVHGDAALHGIRVLLDLIPDLPRVRGDKVQLQQVVLNLLLNSFDAMKDCMVNEREVHVQAELEGEGLLRVAVRDRGIGLGNGKLDKVFQPFYTTKRDGLGMGLSISRSIIEAHSGRLWAENNPDRGATFYFTVPVGGSVEGRGSSDEGQGAKDR
jgi:two-component system, LuxR family, sensor kinase FixL